MPDLRTHGGGLSAGAGNPAFPTLFVLREKEGHLRRRTLFSPNRRRNRADAQGGNRHGKTIFFNRPGRPEDLRNCEQGKVLRQFLPDMIDFSLRIEYSKMGSVFVLFQKGELECPLN